MDNCVFCRIIEGRESCEKVFESKYVLGILDRNPFTEGHTLLMPKKHREDFASLSDVERIDLLMGVQRVHELSKAKYGANGFNMLGNFGSEAGQKVKHIHIHVIPRSEGDRSFRITRG
jgi:histidine triad (HIT) family protein